MPQAKSIENLNTSRWLLFSMIHCFLPSDVAEFRDTVVWTKFDLAELAECDVNEVEHPGVLRIWTFSSGKAVYIFSPETRYRATCSWCQPTTSIQRTLHLLLLVWGYITKVKYTPLWSWPPLLFPLFTVTLSASEHQEGPLVPLLTWRAGFLSESPSHFEKIIFKNWFLGAMEGYPTQRSR